MKPLFKNIPLILSVLLFGNTKAQNQWKAVSPDKALSITLENNNGKLYYAVYSSGDVIIKSFKLGIERDYESFTNNLSFVKSASVTINGSYTLDIEMFATFLRI